jgi:peptidoglycan hydrolase-like protein with peptidoglycan-binding domain
MRHLKIALIAFLGLAVATVGCKKKADDVNLATNTGFDSLQTEELAQLPQTGAASANQQSAIEVLPIETSPVTQAVTTTTTATAVTAPADGLSYQQKIQTALKNAGLYNGSIDGKIGPGTRKAIEAFQKDHKLKVDGKVGPKTWIALEPYFTGQATAASTTEPVPSAQ